MLIITSEVAALKIKRVLYESLKSIKKRKWGVLLAYRPPNNHNLKLFLIIFFFDETTQSANQLLSKFDNTIIAGVFNIGVLKLMAPKTAIDSNNFLIIAIPLT